MSKTIIKLNRDLLCFQCLRCEKTYPVGDYDRGCMECFHETKSSSLTAIYRDSNSTKQPFDTYLSMGEGQTPLIPIPYNKQSIYLKNESMNPTGSHKDRLSAYIVSKALYNKSKGVVIASSGNAGISLASYAAYAGLECIVISTKALNDKVRTIIQNTGSQLILTDTAMDRWGIMETYVENGYYPATNFINPPVGSNPYGVQGLKNIASEINLQLSEKEATHIIVPTSRADLLWGIWEGFKEEKERDRLLFLPKMFAVEPFPRLSAVIKGADYTQEFKGHTSLPSIAGSTVTYQGVKALAESNGHAVVVKTDEAIEAKKSLEKRGIHLEVSSAASVSAVDIITKSLKLNNEAVIVAIGTSSSFIEI
ncbi:pyridoxal-phosphate dependent enzyme [Jeotgalibacillus haloalkalitolerans]|uniref:Pyridoxal-phosphate dependent enzyme n=1 Tax=Jeotgalibacillus haloalkalitolerans TaxID=3104292 RepID=A0ABU5KMX3_9BACL|nr:pyridoxal-phosphate dependent enzyme [Jeotgalibacillus sp. HH7-29]MDZ5712594.1 pyridoxal-phosphate dependent enzyme [Jeotgalibacillus sp. HH7-29]